MYDRMSKSGLINPQEFKRIRQRNFNVFLLLSVSSFIFLVIVIKVGISHAPSGTENAVAAVHDDAPKAEANIRLMSVLVPRRPIAAGTPLEPDMFRSDMRPVLGDNKNLVTSFEMIKGQYSRSALPSGSPLSNDLITPIRPSSLVTAQIPQGYRAVTISVDARSGVEGWARPGARVDVAWASVINGQQGVSVIVQNALVLSAERKTQAENELDAPTPSTVSLVVSEEDANKVHLASTSGRIILSLRGDNDVKGINGSAITVADLLRGPGERKNLNSGVKVDGSVRIKGPNGSTEEFALVNGKLTPSGSINR